MNSTEFVKQQLAGKMSYENRTDRVSDIDYGFVQPENINLSEYDILPQYEVKAGKPELPFKFYEHKTRKDGHKLLEIANDILVIIPPKEYFPAHLQERITDWEEAQTQVMIDRGVLDLIVKVARMHTLSEQSRINNAVITGPAAVSKTYVAGWIMSALMGLPYYSVTFGPGTESPDVLGGPTLKDPKLRISGVEFLLSDPMVQKQREASTDLNNYLIQLQKDYEAANQKGTVSSYIISDSFKIYLHKIFDELGWGKPYTEGEVGWQDTDLILAYQMGCWIGIDEINRMPDMNLLTDLLDPARRKFSVPGRQGIVEGSPGSFIVATQNPEMYEGTVETPKHLQSRENEITLQENGLQFYLDLYNFFIRGDNPTFIYEGKTYQGPTNVDTNFRKTLDQLPETMLDELITTLAKIHMTMVTMAKENKIGRKSAEEGGNIVFDQRDIRGILEYVTEQWKGKTRTSQEIDSQIQNGNHAAVSTVVRKALEMRYIYGLPPSEQGLIQQMIENMPIWNKLEGAKVHTVGGAKVENKKGKVRLSDTLSAPPEIGQEVIQENAPYMVDMVLPQEALDLGLQEWLLTNTPTFRGIGELSSKFIFDLIRKQDIEVAKVEYPQPDNRKILRYSLKARTPAGEFLLKRFFGVEAPKEELPAETVADMLLAA